jgi:hypothetical protein
MAGKLLRLFLALATLSLIISSGAQASYELETSSIIDVTFIDRLHGWTLWETVDGDKHTVKLSGTSNGGQTWYALASPYNGTHVERPGEKVGMSSQCQPQRRASYHRAVIVTCTVCLSSL